MNAEPGKFVAIGRVAFATGVAALVCAGLAHAAPALPANASPETTSAINDAEQHGAYPTFAGIPVTPKDLRPFAAWKSAITDQRDAGREIAAQADAIPWTLSDTEGWAASARALATPPPPLTTPDDAATDALVAQMRERAKEPPRNHN